MTKRIFVTIMCAILSAAVACSAAELKKSSIKSTVPDTYNYGQTSNEKRPGKGSIQLDLQVDEDSSVYTETRMVTLKNLEASEVEPFVIKSLSKYGSVSVNSEANILVITDMDPKLTDLVNFVVRMDELGLENFVQLETRVVPLINVQASDIESIIRNRLSSDGIVQSDNNLNVLVITDVTGKIEYVMDIIEQLDMPPQQVVIAVRMVHIQDTDFSDVGIDLNALLNHARIDNYYVNNYDRWDKSSQDYSQETKSYYMDYDANVDTLIDALVGTGRAELAANTRIVTLNNRTGSVNVSYGDGISMSATPQVGTGELIKISFSASTGRFWKPTPDATELRQETTVDSQSLQSSFMARNGETFVIGGLESTQKGTQKKQSPILGKLPILGQFFTKKTKIIDREKFIVFITPTIVNSGADASKPGDDEYYED